MSFSSPSHSSSSLLPPRLCAVSLLPQHRLAVHRLPSESYGAGVCVCVYERETNVVCMSGVLRRRLRETSLSTTSCFDLKTNSCISFWPRPSPLTQLPPTPPPSLTHPPSLPCPPVLSSRLPRRLTVMMMMMRMMLEVSRHSPDFKPVLVL